jgi:uncharacterized membrane protein
LKRWSNLMLGAYIGVLAWQIIWHGLIPPPWGARLPWLAVLACLPLLVTLPGMLRMSYRGMIWAGLVLLLYFTIGVMELWSNPPQRPAAALQVMLTTLYLFAFFKRNQAPS